MIVKHTKALDYSQPGQKPKLTLGEEYIVHAIYLRYSGSFSIGISMKGDPSPILKDICFFEVVDSRVPIDWGFFSDGNGCYDLKPQEFAGNFLETYFDSTPEEEEQAQQVFNNVLIKIKRFHDRWDL